MYTKGQKVCIWETDCVPGSGIVRILREIIITITDIKTGVLGEFSREPTPTQSLRGTGDDGKVYEKHWDSWPESQTNDFVDQWSMRDDAVSQTCMGIWIPKEAVYVHGHVARHNKRNEKKLKLLDRHGNAIVPKGDIAHCKKHDFYSHVGIKCLYCHMEERHQKQQAEHVVVV